MPHPRAGHTYHRAI